MSVEKNDGHRDSVMADQGREERGELCSNGIMIFTYYHKYWADVGKRIKNPCFDSISGRILDLKEGKMSAVHYFYNVLDKIVPKDVSICVVPSSKAATKETGLIMLGKVLAANGRKDRVCFLERTRTIPKLATGGRRSKEIHLHSIAPRRDMTVENETVFLLDDVTTTGNSLLACRDILMAKGARAVEMLALGKAIWLDKDIPDREVLQNGRGPKDKDAGERTVRRSEYVR